MESSLIQTLAEQDNISCRPLADFHPDVWKGRFLLHTPELNFQAELTEQIDGLKQQVRKQLLQTAKPLQQLQLIDTIQKLGVEYYFDGEIEQALLKIFERYNDYCRLQNDLYSNSLCFRLLRQHGHMVSCEDLDKFEDAKGEFLTHSDAVLGMLELYEAAHLSIKGENGLDHAIVITRTNLESMLSNLSQPVGEQVHYALHKFSVRRGLTRLGARHYMSIYKQTDSHNEALLQLARLDFNMLQCLHKEELSQLCSWWKKVNVIEKLQYARDRLIECYFWILGVYFEPQYRLAREILTKVLAMASMIDDTYDAYATFEELEIFTDAIERWNMDCLALLPEYMKVLYTAMLELYDEIKEKMTTNGTEYRVAYGVEAIKELARAYFEEAKWRKDKYVPTMEEYMPVAMRSCGYTSLIITSFLGLGDTVTKEAFDWILSKPEIIKATEVICRLRGDIAAHEFERKREHIPSAVECYMKEHGVSEEEAIQVFNHDIEGAWKDINQGFLTRPTIIPLPLLRIIINFSRVIETTHKKGDYYTHVGPEMQDYVNQLLIDPIPE